MAGAASKVLKVIITGDAKGATKAFKVVAKEADKSQTKFAKFGKIAGASMAVAGAAAVGFAIKSANTFKTVGSEILKLQRATGLSAEAASKLRFAFQQTGIKVDVGARSIAMFGKKLAASKDTVKDFGIKTRDASGHLLPMGELINRAADRLSKMKNTTERNALAMKLFGKSGVEMTKFLDKGRAGIAKLSEQAKKYGLVLTKDNLVAVKKSIMAHRQQEAAMQGLQVQIGMHVLPVLTKLTTFFATSIPKVVEWTKKHQGLAKVVGGVLLFAIGAYIVAMGAAAIATIAATWEIIAIIAAIGALVAGVIYAYKHWDWFRKAVDATVKFFKTKALPAIKAFAKSVGDAFAKVAAWVRQHWDTIKAVIKVAWTVISGYVKFYIAVVRNVIQLGMNIIRGDWGKVWDQIKGLASGAWSNIKAGAAAGISSLVGLLKSLPGKAVAATAGMTNTFYNLGVHWMASLIHGIQSLAGNVVKAIISKIPGGGLISKAAHGILGLAGGGKSLQGVTGLTGSSIKTSISSAGSAATATGSGVPIVVVSPIYLDGKKIGETVRNHAIDTQRRTGKPWLPGAT